MALTKCSFCSYTYDEWFGDSRNGVPAGTPLSVLAGTVCSRCGLQGVRHERQPSPKYAGQEAEYYDQFTGKAGISFYSDWLKEASQAPTVLELGVGTGRIAIEIAGHSAQVCGVDWSRDMLKIAEAKKERILKDHPGRFELIEADVMDFDARNAFSHILCPDGMFQHYTMMADHVALLQRIRHNLQEGGWLAVDLLLPPDQAYWQMTQHKKILNNKMVYKKVEGETSLSRQLFRCSVSFETYTDGTEQSRYRVEREYALMTPKELALLLAAEGFQIVKTYENYGLSTPWQTALLPDMISPDQVLGPTETLEELLEAGELERAVPYRKEAWMNGGYPLDGAMAGPPAHRSVRMTILARRQ
ncbi:methyltransferase domain-containing protein [Paenibacillus sp. SYP-B3998]|uniref:Methyltransferase domain-containing protein n=1 Tax=Paenibacillus sp. SYP-B3998 TaxID=2678564 RepID=A0A6G3ZV23_9BACL|nr:methyltransferase domain-containing protein [Paenibacillus sp. SYP-B3998]NEW05920.1 methyltransferase domain-containing protein [Paenibacillus sp. SYP-B3998]